MVSSRLTLRNRLKLRQLALLTALDETGSLHKAADRLGMSQPAATRLLQDLEDLMGDALFERTSKGMLATGMGRLLIRHAAMVLAGIDHVYEEAMALRQGSAGSLRIGMFPGVPAAVVAQAVAAVKRATPQVDVQLVAGDNDALLSDLAEGGLGVVVGRPPVGALASALHFERLFTDHFSVACGAGNTRVPAAPAGLPELLAFPWVLPFPGTALRQGLDIQFLGQCGRLPQDLTECVSIAAVQALLDAHGALAVLPGAVARSLAAAGQARIVLDRLAGLSGHVGLITRAGEARSAPLARLADALHTAVHAMAAGDQESASVATKS